MSANEYQSLVEEPSSPCGSYPSDDFSREDEEMDFLSREFTHPELDQQERDLKESSKRGRCNKASKHRAKKNGLSWRQSNRTRRLVANARERSRIHIMSEAFNSLRKAVPCYSHDQKLSKLAILRIATSYISALANLAETDTSTKSLKHFAECVNQCTQALQSEGRSRRKRE